MKKYILDLTVTENIRLHTNYVLIKLTQSAPLPEMLPGQFAEIRIDGSNTTFLRRLFPLIMLTERPTRCGSSYSW